MIPALSTPTNRHRSLLLLAACVAAATGAALLGIDDNPPGLALAFLAAIALLLALAHPWRRSVQFRYLFYASGAGFLVFAVAHNAFEALAHGMKAGPVATVVEFLGVAGFFIAVLLCPAGLLVGGAGAVVAAIWSSRSHAGNAAT